MASKDPVIRKLASEIAVNTQWATCQNRTARTAAARQGFNESFEKQVDPEGALDPAERAKRAEWARKAHFKRLALKSAKARAARKAKPPEAEIPDEAA